jgi:protein gp37
VADLAETPAALRWVSVEPMLGRIIPGPLLNCLRWAVLGGESGQHARPMHPDWPREFLKACDTTDVAFFFKQWGEWLGQLEQQVTHSGGALAWVRARDGRLASTEDVDCIELREGHQDDWKIIRKVGKKAAGRLLDGVEHNAMPEPRA